MWRTDGCDAVSFARLAVIDSRRWISFLLNILPRLDDVDFAALSDVEKRMLQMFYITIWGKAVEDWGSEEVQDNRGYQTRLVFEAYVPELRRN